MTMIASSTRSPSDTMSEPRDTMCRSMPFHFMKRNAAATTTGTHMASTSPLRRPSEKKDTAMTMASASRRASVNSAMDSFTTFG